MSRVGRGSFMILILTLVMSSMAQASFFKNARFHVHLLNRIGNNAHPLMVHVKSGEDDFGEHAVWKNGDFQFSFNLNFWWTTLFYCEFKHGNKTKAFDIFADGEYETRVCFKPRKTVYWKVKEDGFYRSCDDQKYVKIHDWGRW